MTKEKKVLTKEEIEMETIVKGAVDEINAIAKKYNVSLQPFMEYAPYGIIPRVRIVVNKQEVTLSDKIENHVAGEPA